MKIKHKFKYITQLSFSRSFSHSIVYSLILGILLVVSMDKSLSFSSPFQSLVLNALPIFLLIVMLLLISRRFLLSAFVVICLSLTIYTLNDLKLDNLNIPLLFSDLILFTQVVNNMELFSQYIVLTWYHAVLFVISLLILWVLIKKDIIIELPNKYRLLFSFSRYFFIALIIGIFVGFSFK